MRMGHTIESNVDNSITAEAIINNYSLDDLAEIFLKV